MTKARENCHLEFSNKKLNCGYSINELEKSKDHATSFCNICDFLQMLKFSRKFLLPTSLIYERYKHYNLVLKY